MPFHHDFELLIVLLEFQSVSLTRNLLHMFTKRFQTGRIRLHHLAVIDIDWIDHDMRMIIVAIRIRLVRTIECLVVIVKICSRFPCIIAGFFHSHIL